MDRTVEPLHLVVMGVSGSGKTTLAHLLHERLGWALAEGDDFHRPQSIDKMAAGRALPDGDRIPWLGRLATWTRDHDDAGSSTIISCSALRRQYRDVLRTGGRRTFFVHLTAVQGVLLDRMRDRDHFMPPGMLDAQLATLERLGADEAGMTVEVTDPPRAIADRVLDRIGFS